MLGGNAKTRNIAAALRLAESFVDGGHDAPTATEALTAIRSALKFLPAIERRKAHQNSYHRRIKPDPKYKAWIASLACSVPGCGLGPIHVCHVGERGFSNRCADRETAPFCEIHHQDNRLGMHGRLGRNFWQHYGLDQDELIADLNCRYDARFE